MTSVSIMPRPDNRWKTTSVRPAVTTYEIDELAAAPLIP